MANVECHPSLTNVTFAQNAANSSGGGVHNTLNSILDVTNTILWANIAPSAPELYKDASSTATFTHSLAAGSGGSGGGWNPAFGTDGGNNLDADPMFKDAVAGNLRVWSSSPVIDAGEDNFAWEVLPDPDGNPRAYGDHMDIGAYEYQGPPTAIDGSYGRTPVAPAILRAPFPNPFNPSVTITFDLRTPQFVRLSIFDVEGRLVKTLLNGSETTGSHKVRWKGTDNNGNGVASGVYFVQLSAGEWRGHKKIVFLK
jgi:hypothetical protein